ncbi:MAG: HEAT repeat domain-containing protein [Acidobacteria bacterium]|nr:HEAT repeat domain-containing protein [Acidobacteriota bacterium]
MTEPRAHRRIVRNRKKNCIPLSKLRTSDAVRTVVDHPRRLQELLRMLEEKDRSVRGRAAVALAQLSESHPARLIRVAARLKEALADDSAYVRWHLLYALGRLGSRYPIQSRSFLSDLVLRLDDENRVCRVLAGKALGQIGSRRSGIVEECFKNLKKEIPLSVSRMLHNAQPA